MRVDFRTQTAVAACGMPAALSACATGAGRRWPKAVAGHVLGGGGQREGEQQDGGAGQTHQITM